MQGLLAPNEVLTQAELLAKGKIHGPEDTAFDSTGAIYTGTSDGKIVRILPEQTVETFATTGGRPLGLRFDPHGNLIVADAVKGLLAITRDGVVTTLATEAESIPFNLADALDVASDSRVYFSDATSRTLGNDDINEVLEAKP